MYLKLVPGAAACAQGPLMLAEIQIKRWWRAARLRPLPAWVSTPATILLLLTVAGPLFYAPVG